MQVPTFLTNKWDIGPTVGAGALVGIVFGNSQKQPQESLLAIILAVALRTIVYYCGAGVTIGSLAGLAVLSRVLPKGNKEDRTSHIATVLLGSVAWGAIGYGVERAVRHYFFK